jgi:hypothetical protein
MSENIKVRCFNKAGIEAVRQFLSKIRTDNDLHSDEAKALLSDLNLTESVKAAPEINLEQTFATKMDMIGYFTPIFHDDLMTKHQRDSGLWTWLAIAYYKQFLKSKNSILQVATDCCWIFDPDEYRFSRRHFIAGTMYLYRDFGHAVSEGLEMFFAGEPYLFGGLLDAITYKEEFARIPAMLQIAVWLYYKPDSPKKVKPGAATQDKPGTVRELARMADQFAMTYDIFNAEDAGKLWNLLPAQFDKFKGDAQH